MPDTNPSDIYRNRCEAFTAERDRLDRRIRYLVNGRMGTFLLAVICLASAWDAAGLVRGMLLVSGLLVLFLFVALIAIDSKTRVRRRLQDILLKVNEDAGRRLMRDWDRLPEPAYGPPADHAHAADLDLFGHASLFQLLGTAVTIPARETVRDWLLQAAEQGTIRDRQQAVAELAPLLDYRNHLEAHGRLIGREHPRALHAFLDWTKGETWLLRYPYLIWATRVLPLITIVLLGLSIAGNVQGELWLVPVVFGLVITWKTHARITPVFALVLSGDIGLRRYGPLFQSAAAGKFRSPLLNQLCTELEPATAHMQTLDRILTCAEARHSDLLHGVLQIILLWDHNVLFFLERWQRNAGPSVETWVNALGQLEALAALAALSHAHPDWAFPELAEVGELPTLQAENLGHPLLRPDQCVENDVTIGPAGTFLFVTGSNMSGKSTLLRSVGVNAVLAQAGGPVHATRMRLPRVSVYTSMRVSDSLDLGISQYMAQLKRLKLIVEGARIASEEEAQPQALFLLDEILQGTNSAERLVAVRRIIRKLLDYSAIGAVTSHELTVPDIPELSGTAEIVHFRETAEQTSGGVTLSFDYRMRAGLSTSTNALQLMEMVGLE